MNIFPNPKLLTLLFSIFFILCTSGFFYVILTGAELSGYTINENRTLVESDVYLDSITSQFGLESFYLGFFITYFVLSTFALYYSISQNFGQIGKCNHFCLRFFVLSSGYILYQIILLLKEKNNSYLPSLFPSIEKRYPKYSK